MKMQTYNSNATVKARRVTAKEGEDVVTTSGRQHVAYGDYVVEEAGATRVQDAASFEATYSKRGGKSSRKTTSASDPDAPAEVAGTDDKSPATTPDPAKTAKARVAAARQAKAANKK